MLLQTLLFPKGKMKSRPESQNSALGGLLGFWSGLPPSPVEWSTVSLWTSLSRPVRQAMWTRWSLIASSALKTKSKSFLIPYLLPDFISFFCFLYSKTLQRMYLYSLSSFLFTKCFLHFVVSLSSSTLQRNNWCQSHKGPPGCWLKWTFAKSSHWSY